MRDAIRELLARYSPATVEPSPERANAGVLLLLYEHLETPHIVFQKRTDSVRDHKGQISFPGGAEDPGDIDLAWTALRETHEEMGVDPGHVDLLGRLDDMVTISNFRVTPYVGWLREYPYPWRVSDIEVAYLLEVPIPHLTDPANFVPDRRQVNGQWHTLPAFRFQDDLIWGATARMLMNFLDLLAANDA